MDTVQLKEKTLSARELAVLELIAQGHKDSEVACLLEIQKCTVRFHIRNILEKLKVKNRAAAVYYAFKKGWIT